MRLRLTLLAVFGACAGLYGCAQLLDLKERTEDGGGDAGEHDATVDVTQPEAGRGDSAGVDAGIDARVEPVHDASSDVKCDGSDADTFFDPLNCGSCGVVCDGAGIKAHQHPSCRGGNCHFACNDPWQDCDLDASNGCERDLSTDLVACGACGRACAATGMTAAPMCTGGDCVVSCDLTHAHCSADAAAGCETDLSSDPLHCGACPNVCDSGACEAGLCAP